MSADILLLELVHQLVNVDAILSDLVVHIVLSLYHFELELDLTLSVDSCDVEVEAAGSDR